MKRNSGCRCRPTSGRGSVQSTASGRQAYRCRGGLLGSSTGTRWQSSGMIEPELAQARGAVGFDDQRGDARRNQDRVPAAAGVFGNDGLDWSLQRPVRQRVERRSERLPDDRPVAGRSWPSDRCVAPRAGRRGSIRTSAHRDRCRRDETADRRARRQPRRLRGRARRPSRRRSGEWHRTRRRRAASRRRQLATASSCFVPPMRPPRPAARITPMRRGVGMPVGQPFQADCPSILSGWKA